MRQRFRTPKKIYKRGKWWCFRITDSFGKRRVIKSSTKEDALAKLRIMPQQMMSDMCETVSYRITLEQGIVYWLEHKKDSVVSRSLERYRTMGNHLIGFMKERYPRFKYIDETQKEDAFALAYRNFRFEKGRATKTVSDEENAFSDLYKFLAKKKKIYLRNPFSELEPISIEPVQQRRVLPNEELKKFFKGALRISQKIYWYGVFMVFMVTSMRREELRLMEKVRVNLETGFFEIPKTKTRRRKVISKTVPIHPQLKVVLQEAITRSTNKYLFPNQDGEPMPKNKMRDTMRRICKMVGIPMATLNDLRHTWSTKTRLAGMSNEARREIGGWSSDEVMNTTYTHYPDAKISEEYFGVNFMDFLDDSEAKRHDNGTKDE
jgi:integrase